jgi:YHS domain-containing protein
MNVRTIVWVALAAFVALALVGCTQKADKGAGGTTTPPVTAKETPKAPDTTPAVPAATGAAAPGTGAVDASKTTTAAKAAPANVGNTRNTNGIYLCPVDGTAIPDVATAQTMDYAGRTFYICSAACLDKAKASPATYLHEATERTAGHEASEGPGHEAAEGPGHEAAEGGR